MAKAPKGGPRAPRPSAGGLVFHADFIVCLTKAQRAEVGVDDGEIVVIRADDGRKRLIAQATVAPAIRRDVDMQNQAGAAIVILTPTRGHGPAARFTVPLAFARIVPLHPFEFAFSPADEADRGKE